MGVDARMQFRTQAPLTEHELKDFSWKLSGAFYNEPFYTYEPNSHVIEAKEGEKCVYDVNISGRYYGKDYERGPLMTYINIAEWLEFNILGLIEIKYGGDSSDELESFDRRDREELKNYFFTCGHLPYQGYSSHTHDEKTQPVCKRCNKPMLSCGGGGRDEFYRCYGCVNKCIADYKGNVKSEWSDDIDFFSKCDELKPA